MYKGKLLLSLKKGFPDPINAFNKQIARGLLPATLLLIAPGVILTGCGSSEANKSAPPVSSEQSESRPGLTSRGQFIDSPVSGLFYETPTQQGYTDHNGYFSFADGETISFSIGNISLGSSIATEVVTPNELGNGATDATLNILRLLQTLDDDGDPSNGIAIDDQTHLAALQISGNTIDVSVSKEEFETNPELLDLISRTTNISELVDGRTALSHFQLSLERLAR